MLCFYCLVSWWNYDTLHRQHQTLWLSVRATHPFLCMSREYKLQHQQFNAENMQARERRYVRFRLSLVEKVVHYFLAKKKNIYIYIFFSANHRAHQSSFCSDFQKYWGPFLESSVIFSGPKLRPAYSVQLIFSCVIKETITKINANFRASRRHRFEETKRIWSSEMRPKSFGTFDRETGLGILT